MKAQAVFLMTYATAVFAGQDQPWLESTDGGTGLLMMAALVMSGPAIVGASRLLGVGRWRDADLGEIAGTGVVISIVVFFAAQFLSIPSAAIFGR